MDAYEAIVTKRDTRSYLPDPVAPDTLERVLRAARMAGSAKNFQLTRLVVVTEPDTRTALTACGDFTSWIDKAPVVVVLVAPVEGGRLFDLGRMAQNLMVAANELGLATCPVTFHHQDRLREALGVPSDMEGPMAVTLGHPGPGDPDRPSAPRLPLEDLVHRERWQD
ncbi:MAG: nitroreductase family protein [Acidimicrobiales bacterium]